ncbi:Murein L,D-transpeptidase YcbB/YkuD [Faunimonas pinastri]|uniref:Murein L,D-transpeptidase YcbB/YkuD n=1 Tax=Faunimonas pinastri TaxID=1855383 RepID=A0A1H8Z2Q3_9HYPH|nr:L,D-transpeptidase family protein [Faunimonas pinastri]SEP58646.1 Murein L,D-transpeptidase YcbB/YkuD [Faunimonas pinastri]
MKLVQLTAALSLAIAPVAAAKAAGVDPAADTQQQAAPEYTGSLPNRDAAPAQPAPAFTPATADAATPPAPVFAAPPAPTEAAPVDPAASAQTPAPASPATAAQAPAPVPAATATAAAPATTSPTPASPAASSPTTAADAATVNPTVTPAATTAATTAGSMTIPNAPSEEFARNVQEILSVANETRDPAERTLLGQIQAFYETRGFAPIWIQNGRPTAQMQKLQERMHQAGFDGLDPRDYSTISAEDYGDDVGSAAATEVDFSRAVARYASNLAGGRFSPENLDSVIGEKPWHPAANDVLSKLSASASPAADMDAFQPPQQQYAELKEKLGEILRGSETPAISVASGKTLRVGMQDARVATLRERLAVPADAEPNLYDQPVADAVSAFQAEHHLKANGVLSAATVTALNGGKANAADLPLLVANMERWRWMPRDMGAFNVTVNVPEFQLRIFDNGKVVHQTRVVVGKSDHQTPLFSNAIQYLVVNPYWNVPSSIITKEMMPSIRANPVGYFKRHNYQVLRKIGGRTVEVSPASIDWGTVNPRTLTIRQDPGDQNALGKIKFLFPNDYAVYLHDTPSKSFFARDMRALSHGCVRVDNPMDFADALLAHNPQWNAARLKKMFGDKERWVKLDNTIPVHLAYFTAWVDEGGNLRRFADVYGVDRQVLRALGSSADLMDRNGTLGPVALKRSPTEVQ